MFVYDEFQYAATINPQTGEERDNKSGLKPFWELLDSGILHKRNNFWNVRMPLKVLEYMCKINARKEMVIEHGVWTNVKECLDEFKPYTIREMLIHSQIQKLCSNHIIRMTFSKATVVMA